jgi:hypothetical protein
MNEEQLDTRARGISIAMFLAGIWLILSPFLLGYGDGATNNSVITGIVIAAVSTVQLNGMRRGWAGWLMAAAGLWLVIAPFALGFTEPSVLWNELIVGLIVAGLSIWGRLAVAPLHTHHHQTM